MLSLRVLAATLLVPGLLVACDGGPPGGEPPESPESKIIEGGYAASCEISGAGEVLVAYVDPPEDDEGTYLSAWRLYDASGDWVADGEGSRVEGGSATPELWPLPEGFLIKRPAYSKDLERIDPSGLVSPVEFVARARPTRAGDMLVSEPWRSRARFYRPSDGTSYRLPELPRDVSSTLIDRAGGVWVVHGDAGETAYSPDGRPPWRSLDHDLPAGSTPGHLQASGDAMLLPLLDDESSTSGITGLLTQPIGSPGTWHRVEVDGVDSRRWTEPEVAVVAPGRLLLGDWGPRWYLGAGGTWTRMELPNAERGEDFFLEHKGGRIFATSTQGGGVLEWSDDLGRTWHELGR